MIFSYAEMGVAIQAKGQCCNTENDDCGEDIHGSTDEETNDEEINSYTDEETNSSTDNDSD